MFKCTRQSRPRALLRMQKREIKSSGETWSKIVSDWFQQKNNKSVSDQSIQVCTRRLNMRRVSGFFLRNVEVNTTGRWATPADS